MPPPPEKFPPPFYWLKRLLLAYALLIPTLLATWFTWSWYAHRALQQQIDAAHARGEPILPEDFDRLSPNVDPSRNAALHYERAISLCIWTTTQNDWDNNRDSSAPMDYDMLASISTTCTAALDEAYLAATLPEAQWSHRPSAVFASTTWNYLGQRRLLANTLALTADYHHHIHDDDAALRDVTTILHLADAQRPAHVLIEGLVADAIESLAANTLMKILPDLKIGSAPKSASPAAARQLIARLLDDKTRIHDRVLCWYGERTICLFYDGIRTWRSAPIVALLKASPVYPSAQARNAAEITTICQAQEQPFYRDMHPLCDPAPPEPEDTTLAQSLCATLDIPLSAFARATLLEQRSLADRRLAATALAIHLFKAENAAPFTSLDQLVPTYLFAIPLDPLALDHHALRYQPAPPVARLYSTGDDGVDDHGSMNDKTGRPTRRFSALDLNYYLASWPPPP